MRRPERGTAIIITMMLVVALLAGGSVLVSMQIRSTRDAGLSRSSITSLYCAEAGLAAAREPVAANFAVWSAALCNPAPPRGTGACVIGSTASEPAWLRAPFVVHDLDGDGSPDFVLTLVDNDDEIPSDLTTNSDQNVLIVSTCIMNPDVQTQVSELVRYDPVTGKLARKLWLRSE